MAQIVVIFSIFIIYHRFISIHAEYLGPSQVIEQYHYSFELSYITVAECLEYHDKCEGEAKTHWSENPILSVEHRQPSGNCPRPVSSLNWDVDDSGLSTGTCVPTEINCQMCYAMGSADGFVEFYQFRMISLMHQESELEKNKIITGLNFVHQRTAVHLQIQEATLLRNGSVDNDKAWKDIKFEKPGYIYVNTIYENFTIISLYNRIVYLDEIFVPDDYVVTGVRFAPIENTAPHKGVKLMVKGTQYDESFRLLDHTSLWFDYHNSSRRYRSPRRVLDSRDGSYLAGEDDKTYIDGTNYYVRFRANSLRMYKAHLVPYFEYKTMEAVNGLCLGGVGLAFRGQAGLREYISVRVFPVALYAKSLKFLPTINLRTTTTTNEPTVHFPINMSTPPPPIVQPIPRRMRIHPVNVSCSETFVNGAHDDEEDVAFDYLFMPIEKSDVGSFCQFNLVWTVVLLILS